MFYATCLQFSVLIYHVGSFLGSIRWLGEQNLDAITTGAIRVRTRAVGYTLVSIFSVETYALKATCNESAVLNSESLSVSAYTSSFGESA